MTPRSFALTPPSSFPRTKGMGLLAFGGWDFASEVLVGNEVVGVGPL